MADPIYKFATQDSIDKMLSVGVLSTESNKGNTQKMMDLMAMMVNINTNNVNNTK